MPEFWWILTCRAELMSQQWHSLSPTWICLNAPLLRVDVLVDLTHASLKRLRQRKNDSQKTASAPGRLWEDYGCCATLSLGLQQPATPEAACATLSVGLQSYLAAAPCATLSLGPGQHPAVRQHSTTALCSSVPQQHPAAAPCNGTLRSSEPRLAYPATAPCDITPDVAAEPCNGPCAPLRLGIAAAACSSLQQPAAACSSLQQHAAAPCATLVSAGGSTLPAAAPCESTLQHHPSTCSSTLQQHAAQL